MTYNEFVQKLEKYEFPIRCDDFAERREAIDLLSSLGYKMIESTEDYIEMSESHNDHTFMYPGLNKSGEIIIYNPDYCDDKYIALEEAIQICDDNCGIDSDISEEEFKDQIMLLFAQ